MATQISTQELLERLALNSTQQPQPRTFSHRTDLPSDLQLPPLDKVRDDAGKVAELTQNRDARDVDVRRALECNTLLPNLFEWSFHAQPNDTPEDLREGCIFALEMFIRILHERDEDVLQRVVHTPPEQDFVLAAAWLYSIGKASHRLVYYLTLPEVDRPAEALPHLKLLAKIDIRMSAQTGPLPWIRNPSFYTGYANALALSGSTDTTTKFMLECAIEGAKRSDSDASLSIEIVFLKLHLAHVHRCQNIQTEEARENERYVIRFLRKNPELFEYARLKQALIRPGQPERHVLTALGGPAWLNGAGKQTFKIQLRPGVERRCFTCGACEPQKKLFRCSGCQQIWYCSKRCQAAEWKTHKISCREIRREREALDALQYSGFGNIQRSADWMKCRIGSFGANNSVPMHALGMQRDPSRGRTHIIFYNVEYTSRASRDMKNKFRVNSVGVYRTSDVIPEIEASLLMKPGEGKTHIDAMLASVDLNSAQCGTEVRFPGVYILTGKELVPTLGSFCVCEKTLLNTPYDPNWRLTMNEGAPPTVMCLTRRGVTVQNAEHIFE